MNCPHCSAPIAPGQGACLACGFSATAIRAYLGSDWVRLERITDVSNRLNLRDTRHIEVLLDEFERRFPQCFMAAYIGMLPETLTLRDLGFWLINHGAFHTHQVTRRNDFAIVMLVDPLREEVAVTVGYALEQVLTEPVLTKILNELTRPLKRGEIARCIERACDRLDRELRRAARLEKPRAERAPSVVGDASDLGLQSLRPGTQPSRPPSQPLIPRAH
ncbi:MAG: TPM domain-containing protein [Verrucomicrobiota bacterium]